MILNILRTLVLFELFIFVEKLDLFILCADLCCTHVCWKPAFGPLVIEFFFFFFFFFVGS